MVSLFWFLLGLFPSVFLDRLVEESLAAGSVDDLGAQATCLGEEF